MTYRPCHLKPPLKKGRRIRLRFKSVTVSKILWRREIKENGKITILYRVRIKEWDWTYLTLRFHPYAGRWEYSKLLPREEPEYRPVLHLRPEIIG